MYERFLKHDLYASNSFSQNYNALIDSVLLSLVVKRRAWNKGMNVATCASKKSQKQKKSTSRGQRRFLDKIQLEVGDSESESLIEIPTMPVWASMAYPVARAAAGALTCFLKKSFCQGLK
jgi:hypothetical protein